MSKFTVEYNEQKNTDSILEFEIKGNLEYGLDKTIMNSIRHVLMKNINTVGFDTKKIDMIINETPLNNEYITDRIMSIPLYINNNDINENYLFKLDVINNDEYIKKVTVNDFNIYPLKPDVKRLIMQDSKLQYIPESSIIYNITDDMYDISNALNQEQKDKIFRPVIDINTSKKYYILLIELKLLNSTNKHKINLTAKTNIFNGKFNSVYNNVSCAVYSFKENDKLINEIIQNNIKSQKMKDKTEIEAYTKSFKISDSERYYYRDNANEPYYYNFKIESHHYNSSKELLIESITILMDLLSQSINEIKSSFNNATIDNNVYITNINNVDEHVINLIHGHCINHGLINDNFIELFSFHKIHPLDTKIKLKFLIKQNDNDNIENINKIITFLDSNINNIKSNLLIISESVQ
jgi:hypothetical protein